jgi:hypothetical protein
MDSRDLNDENPGSAEQAHQAMRELLPACATATALGGIPQAIAPELLAHLAICAVCRAELDELSLLTIEAYGGQVAAAPVYPQPDLAFLPAPAVNSREHPWLLDQLGRLVVKFSEALIEALAPRSLAGATRGQFLYRYVQEPGSVRDLEVTIEVFAEDAARGLGRVRVSVDVPSHGPLDQSGSQVVVRADEAAWQGETDETGCVDIAPIPLAAMPRLRVEITPQRTEDGG